VHLHNIWQDDLSALDQAKIAFSVHDYRLTGCPRGMLLCRVNGNGNGSIFRSCATCRGLLVSQYMKGRARRIIEFAQRNASTIKAVAHSSHMLNYCAPLRSPIHLPIPLETSEFMPTDAANPEQYLFYSARCSYEKNPIGFAKLCEHTGAKGILAISFERSSCKDYMNALKRYPVEIRVSPEWGELKDLYRHAMMTVLPYRWMEPFGIAAANSVLAGTPLLTTPYGNLPNLATACGRDLGELAKVINNARSSERFYSFLKHRVMERRRALAVEHDSIKLWDEFYETI